MVRAFSRRGARALRDPRQRERGGTALQCAYGNHEDEDQGYEDHDAQAGEGCEEGCGAQARN
jgi:hypothetical protein